MISRCGLMMVVSLMVVPLVPLKADEPATEFKTFKDCLAIADVRVRVACYDAFATGGTFTPKLAEETRRQIFGLSGAQLDADKSAPKAERADAKLQKKIDKQIEETRNTLLVTVVRLKALGSGELLITTDDGTVWKQRGSGRLKYKGLPFEATIKKAALGSYKISPTSNKSSIKVKRVR